MAVVIYLMLVVVFEQFWQDGLVILGLLGLVKNILTPVWDYFRAGCCTPMFNMWIAWWNLNEEDFRNPETNLVVLAHQEYHDNINWALDLFGLLDDPLALNREESGANTSLIGAVDTQSTSVVLTSDSESASPIASPIVSDDGEHPVFESRLSDDDFHSVPSPSESESE
jgi:hypothetical protein